MNPATHHEGLDPRPTVHVHLKFTEKSVYQNYVSSHFWMAVNTIQFIPFLFIGLPKREIYIYWIYIYLQPYFYLNKGNLVLLTKIYVLLENILCPSLYSSLWASAYCLKCFIILSICHSYLSSVVNNQKTQGLYSADEAIYRF